MADKELKSITFPGLPDRYVIGGTDDYADLEHKPQINGVTLSGNKTTSELSLGSYSKPSGGIPKTDLADAVQTSLGKADTALQSVNAGGVAFDDSATYQDGTVGKELSDQKNAISQKAPLIINSASGDIVTFADGADDMPIKSLVASIEPVQDLHGYEYPWPAGGTYNKLPITLESGTYSGVTAIVYTDSRGIVLSGTKTATGLITIYNGDLPDGITPGGEYIYSWGDLVNAMQLMVYNSSNVRTVLINSANVVQQTITIPADAVRLEVRISLESLTAYNVTIYPMIRASSVSDTTYSPYSNICPISGHTGMTVARTGKNLFRAVDGDYTGAVPNTTLVCADGIYTLANSSPYPLGVTSLITGNRTALALGDNRFVKPGIYAFSLETTNLVGTTAVNNARLVLTNDVTGAEIIIVSGQSATINDPATITEIRCILEGGFPENASISYRVQLERSSAVTEYEQYTETTIPITFPETIYSGSDEVVGGALESTMGMVDLGTLNFSLYNSTAGRDAYRATIDVKKPDNSVPVNAISSIYKAVSYNATWTPGIMSISHELHEMIFCTQPGEYADATAFKAAMSGVQLCYELDQPTEYTLEGHDLNTLYGTNNIWTDVGDVSVDYPADTKLYIDKKISEAVAALGA